MYTTKPLSLYKNSQQAMSVPPEGPNSGHLVIQDEESTPTCCFGLCKDPSIYNLPFPQNKLLYFEYRVRHGETSHTYTDAVYLIPVINQPLSSNQYYVIKADGRHKGEAYASSKEEDMVTCCFFCKCINDVKPRPFDHQDIYQQFEFTATPTCLNSIRLEAKSVAPDGNPPNFLRRYGWTIRGSTQKKWTLGEAHGLDPSLRARLPDFSFPVSQECSSSVTVGRWYVPFMFVKEGREKDQMKKTAFYEMTLEQRWERIFAKEDIYGQAKAVAIDVVVPTQVVRIAGKEVLDGERYDDKGTAWFRTIDVNGQDKEVGLSTVIVERMVWEQERAGWEKGIEKRARVVKDEEYGGITGWRSFGLYMLVESFVLKRNDGSLVLTYDFKHTNQLRSKWE